MKVTLNPTTGKLDVVSDLSPYLKKDGSIELTADWDIGDTRSILADQIKARDGAGLLLTDDGNNGIFVEDGGNVGIGTSYPAGKLHVYSDTGITSEVAFFEGGQSDGDNSEILVGANYTSAMVTVLGFSYDATGDGDYGYLELKDGTKALTWNADGNVGIGTTSPTALLDINSDILRIRTSKTPATAGATGDQGSICWDADYVYVATATNTWKRASLSSW